MILVQIKFQIKLAHVNQGNGTSGLYLPTRLPFEDGRLSSDETAMHCGIKAQSTLLWL
jgi:hypothetical protein